MSHFIFLHPKYIMCSAFNNLLKIAGTTEVSVIIVKMMIEQLINRWIYTVVTFFGTKQTTVQVDCAVSFIEQSMVLLMRDF